MDNKELEAILNDADRLNKQNGGTKDYIIDVCANLLVMAASQKALGTKRFEKHNIENIVEKLNEYDNADRYYDEEIRKGSYNRFKTFTLPFTINSLKNSIKIAHLNPELWTPALKLFFEKAQDYLSLED